MIIIIHEYFWGENGADKQQEHSLFLVLVVNFSECCLTLSHLVNTASVHILWALIATLNYTKCFPHLNLLMSKSEFFYKIIFLIKEWFSWVFVFSFTSRNWWDILIANKFALSTCVCLDWKKNNICFYLFIIEQLFNRIQYNLGAMFTPFLFSFSNFFSLFIKKKYVSSEFFAKTCLEEESTLRKCSHRGIKPHQLQEDFRLENHSTCRLHIHVFTQLITFMAQVFIVWCFNTMLLGKNSIQLHSSVHW